MKKPIASSFLLSVLFLSFFSSIAQDQTSYWGSTKKYGKKAWETAKRHKGKIIASIVALAVASAIASGAIKLRQAEALNREIIKDLTFIVNTKNWSGRPNAQLMKYVLDTALNNDEQAINSMIQTKFGSQTSQQFFQNVLSSTIELRRALVDKRIVQ